MHIIKQKAQPPSLPNFTQLGVLLRILLGVLLVCFLIALYKTPSWFELAGVYSDLLAIMAPVLITTLLGLSLLQKVLARLSYPLGLALVFLWTELCALTVAKWASTSLFELQRLMLTVGVAVFMLAIYFRLRQQSLSPAVTEARLQALQARIRPHFLFNSLNAVISLIRVEPRRAERILENLADLFRVLMADNRQLVPLAKEVELARQYLEIEQVRLGERLQLTWHIDKMPEDAMIPPLILQPLLENAVYHGIEPSIQPGMIGINIYQKGNEVFIQIRNTYIGEGSHHAGNKMAMSNIRERLLLHFDVDAELAVQPGHDYYQVMIRMPYQKEVK
ncbi:sensor histidine kinase [Leeia oryzae]|uniref:sensor histidine kinase n=1 Tax=Leeia oryzae TaxID=356662 RepID=UPI000362DF42|nr:histidine kinase [Leeia oryzae]